MYARWAYVSPSPRARAARANPQKRLPNGYFGNSMRQRAKRDRCARSAPPEAKTAREARLQQDDEQEQTIERGRGLDVYGLESSKTQNGTEISKKFRRARFARGASRQVPAGR
jgi:hypothetical protein